MVRTPSSNCRWTRRRGLHTLDPILNPGDPQQINGYTYANNNPLAFSDPSGLMPCGIKCDSVLYDAGIGGGGSGSGSGGGASGGGSSSTSTPSAPVQTARDGYVEQRTNELMERAEQPGVSDAQVRQWARGQAENEWDAMETNTMATLIGILKATLFDPDACSPGDAGGCPLEVAAALPWTKWLKGGKLLKLGDEGEGVAETGKAIQRVGETLGSVDDVLANPALLAGKTPAQVEPLLHGAPGWRVETLGKGSRKGQGWVFRQYNDRGHPTGPQIRWHPGGRHHGAEPYWRVVGPEGDIGGVIR